MAFGGYMYPCYPQEYYPEQFAQMRQNQPIPNMQPQQVQSYVPQGTPAGNGIIWVENKEEADKYPVDPGRAVALWDKSSPADSPVVYVRQTDITGRPGTITYRLIKQTDMPEINQQPTQQIPQIDMSNLVTWDKLEEYMAERLKRPSKGTQKKEDTDNV